VASTKHINIFQYVGADELAAITFFGKPLADVEGGLVIILPGMELHRFPRGVMQSTIGSNAIGSETKTTHYCKKSLSTMAKGTPDAKAMLERRIHVNPLVFIQWEIFSPCQFLITVGSIVDADGLFHATVKGALETILTKNTVEQIYNTIDALNSVLLREIEILTGDPNAPRGPGITSNPQWGADVTVFRFMSLGLPDEVDEALKGAAAAIGNKDKTITDAEAEAEKRKLEGKADAIVIGDKRREEGKAEADVLAEKAKVLTADPQGAGLLARYEMMVEIAEKLRVPIAMGSGMSELFSAGFAATMGHNAVPAATPPPTPPTPPTP
jgi:regulator of protease activity HflC (stomatin/prohibitin superfamily)